MTPKKLAALTHEVKDTGDVVVCDASGGQLLLLNDTGAAVWLLLDGERSVDDIAALIAETLDSPDTPLERVQGDVVAFLQTLREHGLVELD